MNKLVGVLGGVGPLATVYFEQMVLEMTDAPCDQGHVDMLVMNHATIPDRTDFILGRSEESPLPVMVADAQMLARAGCDFLVLPCNTAHFFYEAVQEAAPVPLINIIEETVHACIAMGAKTVGVLATDGTVKGNPYGIMCERHGLTCVYPDERDQAMLMHIIYDCVKAGKPVMARDMNTLYQHMREKGCDAVVLGCTELSVAHRDLKLSAENPDVIDSLTVLARKTILTAGKTLR